MDSTMPPEVNLLGFSGSVLSLILESLKAQGFSGKIRIYKNIPTQDEISFNPGFDIEMLDISDPNPFPKKGLFLSTINPSVKEAIFKGFKQQKQIVEGQFINIFHPRTTIASTAEFSTGIYLEPGVTVSPFTDISFGVSINRHCSIGHHVKIHPFASINPGVHVAGHCEIGANASIGMGATIFDHITIGSGTIIGGGSVVTKDIPSNVVAYGNPCRIIKDLS